MNKKSVAVASLGLGLLVGAGVVAKAIQYTKKLKEENGTEIHENECAEAQRLLGKMSEVTGLNYVIGVAGLELDEDTATTDYLGSLCYLDTNKYKVYLA